MRARNPQKSLRMLQVGPNQMRESLLFSRVYPGDRFPFRQPQHVTVELQNEQILHRRDKIPFGCVKLKVTVVVYALFV